MPVLATSAYNTADDVLLRVRTILNDSEIQGGDIITNTAVFSFDLLNSAYERVQMELAKVGVEVSVTEAWLIGLPTMPIVDPQGRMVVDDTGCNILYPNNVGNVYSLTPQLPTDLILPLKLWERQTNTTNLLAPMCQPNSGLTEMQQSSFLVDWEWMNDGLRFRGALQSQDVKIKYEKHLPKLAAPTDPVPIRGVVNAAAFFAAMLFAASRGGEIAAGAREAAMEEILLLQQVSARRRQRKQVRRRPYSGGGGRRNLPSL